MPSFSKRSKDALSTVHPDLKELFMEVIQFYDCIVLEGHRDKIAQDAAVAAGNSKTPWPKSKHNSLPSRAVDAAPFPLNWKDRERFIYFAGYVKATADQMGIRLRWGGDWDNDNDMADNKFDDLVHFELLGTG